MSVLSIRFPKIVICKLLPTLTLESSPVFERRIFTYLNTYNWRNYWPMCFR